MELSNTSTKKNYFRKEIIRFLGKTKFGFEQMASATAFKTAADGSNSPRDFEPFSFFIMSAVAQRQIEKPVWTATDKAKYRHRQGLKMADLLEKSADVVHSPRGLAIADCIRATASPENIYFSSEQINFETGELFDGFGVLTEAVSSRLCPSYQARMSKRAKKMARESVARIKPRQSERWRFLTLTMPDLRVGFETTLDVLDTAIVLLKKRLWFKENVRGAIQAIEATIKDAGHFHFHCHFLAISKWISWSELGEAWTDCVKKACLKHDVFFNYETSHNRLIVDVRLVVSKSKDAKKTISLDDAINETCKYLTKSSDFENVPVESLCEIERVLRGRRMIRSFGECGDSQAATGEITAFQDTDTYLDTTDTTDGLEVESAKKLKVETLVEMGTRLITSGRRDEWLLILRRKMSERRDFRRKQLLEMYPGAVFWTLDGKSFRSYANLEQSFDDVAGEVVSIADYKRKIE
jgi:hypothetical protein